VLTRDPDVILIGATGADGARQAADWGRFAQLKAVQKHHIFMVNPSLIGRMAPRILDGVQEVCTALDQARGDPTVSIKRQSPDDISRR
jgi:ABC-type Fe3+-hydroxamate transport system substrate-binding protein